MNRQALVVGLGQFGMSLVRTLTSRNVDVLAVDVDEERVRAATPIAADTLCFDATDEESLARTSPEKRDFCICAIGDDGREASIVCTALLRQMGAERVIARSNDDLHARILRLVGAHQVVNPEREFGDRFANQILYQRIRGEMSLGEGVKITELSPPPAFVGQSLTELSLPRKHGLTVVAIRQRKDGPVVLPEPTTTIESGDVLVVVAKEGAVEKLMDKH